MPSKYQEYRQMADTAERQLTSSYKSWTQFLRTAARLYKYPYNEQVMIHAQRPDATACAEYDFWNKKMGRFVRRGSTGIALIDTSGQKPQLRYVFDVADTGEREHSRPVHLWQFRAEHEDAIAATLERSYDVSGSNGIVEQMESADAQLVKEYWVDNKRDILYNIDDFLPHLAIAMALGLVVIMILDGYNPLMKFLTSSTTKAYIIILAFVVITSSIMLIADNRRG